MREGLLVAGKYKLLKLIGSGGMGSVWLARNEMTEREFAIKFLHASAATNPKVLTRFFQEAKVSGRIRHPTILEIFDVGTAPELENAPFLVMELLDGAPLDLAIRLLGGIPLRLTLQIGIALSRALALAHDKGVVHRDLKPANVFLHRTPSGALLPKLLDFGISKLSPLEANQSDSGMGLTQTGAVLGSPLYMSPEQAAGDKHVDGRSDIHALGVLLWWCLVGRSPFKSTTYNTLVVEIITGERPRLIDAKSDVSPAMSEIVSRCYARKREDRFATTTQLATALEEQLAAMGPGLSLESREWAEEIFGKLRITQSGSSEVPADFQAKAASTTGAVSVSVDDAIPSGDIQSPAAYTVDPRIPPSLPSSSSSSQSGADRIVAQTLGSQSGVNTRRTRMYVWVGGACALLLTVIGVASYAVSHGSATAGVAAAPPHGVTSDVIVQPATTTATPTVRAVTAGASAASVQAKDDATGRDAAEATAPVASSAPPPSAVATHAPPPSTRVGRANAGNAGTAPVVHPPVPTQKPPPAKDPFHGIDTTGL